MKKRANIIVIALLSIVILALSLGVGCTPSIGPIASQDHGSEVVEQAWNIIFEHYVEQDKLDANALSQGAIKGMVESLNDPYTSYLDAEAYQLSLTSLEGSFEGIGAHVAMEDEQITIIAPILDSPADKAGIKAGDIILEINGVSTAGMSLAEAVLDIRGPTGTTVTLLILHEGESEPVEIEIVRADIDLPSVRSEMIEDIAYINITYFSDRTDEELSTALKSMNLETASGVILDLRSNPGGLLQAVVDVAGYFLTEGAVVIVVDNQGEETTLPVKPNDSVTDLPVVVLVDSFSASGSEVLAGALQDHGRAITAGTTTYGKGSVNALYPLKDGSAIYITTARWLTPDGRLIEGEGLHPDYELELEGEDAIQWAIDYLKGEAN